MKTSVVGQSASSLWPIRCCQRNLKSHLCGRYAFLFAVLWVNRSRRAHSSHATAALVPLDKGMNSLVTSNGVSYKSTSGQDTYTTLQSPHLFEFGLPL